MVAFAFLEEPGFVEGDFFGGFVFGLGGAGEVDGVFAEFLIHGIDGFAEGGVVLRVLEKGEVDVFGLFEAGEGDADFGGFVEVAGFPEFEEAGADGDGVVGGVEAGFDGPGARVSGDGEADVGGDVIFVAEAGAGFVEEAEHDGAGSDIVTEFGGKDVGVTEGLAFFKIVGHVVAAEEVPPAFAPDGTEDADEFAGGFVEEVVGDEDTVGVEAGLGAPTDASEFGEFEPSEAVGEVFGFDDDEAVRFLEVGAELGEVGVGGDADAGGEAGGELGLDGFFDGEGDLAGVFGVALVADKTATHFVDGTDFIDGEVLFDAGFDGFVEVGVFAVGGFDTQKFGAEPVGVFEFGASADAVFFGFVTGGDDGGVASNVGDDADGLADKGGVDGLFHAGEVAVEIEEQPAEGEAWAEW